MGHLLTILGMKYASNHQIDIDNWHDKQSIAEECEPSHYLVSQ